MNVFGENGKTTMKFKEAIPIYVAEVLTTLFILSINDCFRINQ